MSIAYDHTCVLVARSRPSLVSELPACPAGIVSPATSTCPFVSGRMLARAPVPIQLRSSRFITWYVLAVRKYARRSDSMSNTVWIGAVGALLLTQSTS